MVRASLAFVLLSAASVIADSPPVRPVAPTPTGPAKRDRHGDPLPPGAITRYGTIGLRHGTEPRQLAFSHDGKLLASVSSAEDGIRLWNTTTGQEVARLAATVSCFGFAPDGSVVMASGTRLKVWMPAAGHAVREFSEKTLPEHTFILIVHPDGRTVAACTPTTITLLDLQTGKTRAELKLQSEHTNPIHAAFSPDGRWLAAAGPSKTGVLLWDVKTGKRVRTYLPLHDKSQPQMTFSPDGDRIAIAADRLYVFPTDSDEADDGYAPPQKMLINPRFSTDGKSVFGLLDRAGAIVRIDAATGEQKDSWVGSVKTNRSPLPFALAPDATYAAAEDETGGIRIWEPRTGKGPSVERLPMLMAPWFSADGKTASCLDAKNRVHTFDPATGQPGKVITVPVPPTGIVTWDARTSRAIVAVGGREPNGSVSFDPPEVHVIDGATGKVLAKIPVPGWTTPAAVLHPTDPDRFVVFTDGAVMIARVSTGKPVRNFDVGPRENHVRNENGLPPAEAMSPDGRLIVVGTSPLSVWEVGTGKRRFEVAAMTRMIGTTFSPDGRTLAAWDGEKLVLFDIRSGAVSRQFDAYPGSAAPFVAATFTPDGKRVAASGADGFITIWDAATGDPVLNLSGHDGLVIGLAFEPDGKRLISTARDGTALVWDTAAAVAVKGPAGAIGADEAIHLLASPDPAEAQRGLAFLSRNPDETVKMLGEKIVAPAATPAVRIAKLVEDLGSEDFQTRQAAVAALETIGPEAAPAILAAVRKPPNPEVRKLGTEVLAKIDRAALKPDDLRALRAVELVEGIGTPAARDLLKKWAAGPATRRLTLEAQEALDRMKN